MTEFNVGDRVYISNHAGIGSNVVNPEGVEGTVQGTEYDPPLWPYLVRWDNGYGNCYRDEHLSLVDDAPSKLKKIKFAQWVRGFENGKL